MPWTSSLTVGVAEIDAQHKTLFEAAEKLFEAGQKRQAAEYIGELLTFLESYTEKHFADEEKYMISIAYPDYAAQKQAHTAFTNELKKLKQDFQTSGGNFTLIMNANKLIIDWMVQHISTMDKKIGTFAQSKGQ